MADHTPATSPSSSPSLSSSSHSLLSPPSSPLLLLWFLCASSLPAGCLSQQVRQVPLQCIALPDGTTLTTAGCNTSFASVSLGSGTVAPGYTASALGYQTTASGFAATAMGQSSNAAGVASLAFGFGTTAGGATSLAGGSGSQTFSDPEVPGGSSAGGAVSLGSQCKSTGDWSLSVGSGSEAYGYTSAAIGCGAVASSWGEVALGLYPEESNMTLEERRNQSVIPTFREHDVVLRVGNGCQKLSAIGGIGCETDRRSDALRVYKSGQLYLKKLDGTVVEDVVKEMLALRKEVDDLQTTSTVLAAVCGVLLVGLVAVTVAVFVARKTMLTKYNAMPLLGGDHTLAFPARGGQQQGTKHPSDLLRDPYGDDP